MIDYVNSSLKDTMRLSLLGLRLCSLCILIVLLTIHIKSLRMFRWEQSVSGGILVTYCVAMSGLALCAGTDRCGGIYFQAYICGVGAALLALNATMIWVRWKRANVLTMAVADLLVALGLSLRKQILTKVFLSATAAVTLVIDLALTWMIPRNTNL